MNKTQEGLADMEEARREKATEEHNVIDDAIQDRGEGYTVFSIVSGVLTSCDVRRLTDAPARRRAVPPIGEEDEGREDEGLPRQGQARRRRGLDGRVHDVHRRDAPRAGPEHVRRVRGHRPDAEERAVAHPAQYVSPFRPGGRAC
jgi:hypothetical protein